MDFYSAIVIITSAFLLVTIIDVRNNRVIDKNMKINCIIICLIIGFSIFCEWANINTNGAPVTLIPLHKIAKVTEFCMAPLAGFMAAYSYCKMGKVRIISTAVILALHIIFEIAVLNKGLVIYIDDLNFYHRGSLYPVYIAVFSFSLLFCFESIIREELKYHTRPDMSLIATLAFLILGIAIQMIDSNLRVDYMCVAIGNYLLYNHRCKMLYQMDGLTQLLNRRCFEKDLQRISSSAFILSMDVNKFKQINDTYGHAAGDRYLKVIAKLISTTYGKYGLCYRYGGDEFCVVLTKKIDKIQELNESFKKSIEEAQKNDSKTPTVSVGYAFYDNKYGHIQQVLEQADKMMYKNKNNQ